MKTTNLVTPPNLFFHGLVIAAGRGRTECEKGYLPSPHQARGLRNDLNYCIRALRSILTELCSEEMGARLVWGWCGGPS